MTAAATVSPMAIPSTVAAIEPVVLIDGVIEPRLTARQYRAVSPLDRRSALLSTNDRYLIHSDPPTDPDTTPEISPRHLPGGVSTRVDRWVDSTATVALPVRLVDDQIRWSVLAHGRLTLARVDHSTRADESLLEVTDAWDRLLDEPVAAVWWQTADGLLYDDTRPAVMRVGSSANRSQQTWPIGDRQAVSVFQEDGRAWTVGSALETLDALAGLGLSLSLIPTEIRDASLSEPVDLAKPIGDVLEQLTEPCGLIVRRDLSRESNRVVELRSVRPIDRGPTVRLAWAGEDQPLGQVLRIDADRPSPAARQWIARADGWLVESTFNLIAGWDPSLETEPDSAYSKSDSSSFTTLANVFRLWALNEDGRFTGDPFNRGDAFDLTTFFTPLPGPGSGSTPGSLSSNAGGQLPGRPRPLRFLPALTLDASSTRRSPVVEFSIDSGVTWSLYTGPTVIRTDRAAIYLDDTTLDPAFLSAAKAGTARVRVTASLRSPSAVQAQRWSGNPFAGTLPAKTFDLNNTFRFQRLAPPAPSPGSSNGAISGSEDSSENEPSGGPASVGSIFFDDVVNGVLTAQQIDESAAMVNWLAHMVDRSRRVPGPDAGRAKLTLTGAWPMLRVGDRLTHTASPSNDAAGRAEAIAAQGAIAAGVTVNFDRSISPNDRRANSASSTATPTTAIDLVF